MQVVHGHKKIRVAHLVVMKPVQLDEDANAHACEALT